MTSFLSRLEQIEVFGRSRCAFLVFDEDHEAVFLEVKAFGLEEFDRFGDAAVVAGIETREFLL